MRSLAALMLASLLPPDDVGSAAYRAVHEHVVEVIDSMEDENDPDECGVLVAELEELADEAWTASLVLKKALRTFRKEYA